jgi:hypothetical protein
MSSEVQQSQHIKSRPQNFTPSGHPPDPTRLRLCFVIVALHEQ